MNINDAIQFFFKYTNIDKTKKFKIKKIHHGFTNCSYLISFSKNEKYQIRLADNNDIVDRKNEYNILKLINCDQYIYYDVNTGNAIKKWINGNNLSKWRLSTTLLDNLFNKIDHFHSYKSDLILKHDYYCFIDIVKNKIDIKYLDLYTKLVNELIDINDFYLSHNDLNFRNIIYNKNDIYFIDYEWGRLNNIYFDYCNFVRESNLNKKYINYIINHLNISIDKFNKYLYICVCFAMQWTYATKYDKKIKKYRKKTQKQLDYYYNLITNIIVENK